MSIKDKYSVRAIQKYECKEWLLEKHYARRVPSISYAFGLYESRHLLGVCTYGTPCKLMNDGFCIFAGDLSVKTLELNRLVIKDNLEKNCISFFVSQSLSQLPQPLCVVSYADIGEGHHGYIYQATNWFYTGVTDQTGGYTYFFDDDWQHPRTTVSKFGTREHSVITDKFPGIEFKKVSRKHRYFQFLGTKKERMEMQEKMKYQISPYPKGDNKRYDASYEPTTQALLF